MGARPGVLALPAIPFVNLGQSPTFHVVSPLKALGMCAAELPFGSHLHISAWRPGEECVMLPDGILLGQDCPKYEGNSRSR